jgi:hypothetical protein
VQLEQDLADFGDAGVLVPVVRYGFPEGDYLLAGYDWLTGIHRTPGRVAGRFQPPGDSHGPAHMTGVSARRDTRAMMGAFSRYTALEPARSRRTPAASILAIAQARSRTS